MAEGSGSSGAAGAAPPGAIDRALWRELRIAPILTGGSSLAVWIGGVSAELYRVVNCLDDPDRRRADRVYRSLLELTGTRPLVDVVTGTSAGGLNGVLLSTAWALRAPTETVVGLRDLWMELGAIESLLRSPNEKDPPSLLRGDAYFWPQLTQVVERIAAAGSAQPGLAPDLAPPHPRPVDLALTVTTLSGERTRRTDDTGQELQETRQDHILRFLTPDFGRSDDPWSRRLALAARTSASIPGVFEASYLPVDEPAGNRPGFGDRASFSVGRWAVDGGVLANQPIGAARLRIIDRSAGAELRRVALFVNPTPSRIPAPVADDAACEPLLTDVATGSLAAPHNIGIRHEIDDLREHNERVRRSIEVGRGVARVVAATAHQPGGPDPVDALAASLYDGFRRDRAVLSVTTMLDRIGHEVADHDFPRRAIEEALVQAVQHTDDWLPRSFEHGFGVDRSWVWGIAPLEHAAGLLLELVRRIYALPTDRAGEDVRRALGEARGRIHAVIEPLDEIRRTDSEFWRAALRQRSPLLAQWAEHAYLAWPDAEMLESLAAEDPATAATNHRRAQVQHELGEVATHLAGIAVDLRSLVARVDLPDRDAEVAHEVHEHASAIRDLDTLFDAAGGAATSEVPAVVGRIVALHVVAVSLGDTSRRHAPIELLEVSWRASNVLDPARRPEEKLAGTEFGRLGAFVKRSWRANDWMWGRLDGSAQLVRLLLDPHRLRQLRVAPEDVIATLESLDGVALGDDERRSIGRELGFLQAGAEQYVSVPSVLPTTTEAFLARVQLDIAREELPEVYFAVLRSREEGAGEGDGGDFRRSYESATRSTPPADLPDDEVVALFGRCRIGSETAADEVGRDLLTRTAGATTIVAANAVTGERSGLRWPGRVARPFRQVALLGYVLTRASTTTSRTGMAVTGVLTAVAGAIVAMFLLDGRTGVGINSGLVLLAVLILGLGLFLAILRSGVLAALPGFVALLVVALALIGDGMAAIVTGSAELDPDVAWRHTVFLGSWPIVTLVLIVAGLGWIISAFTRLSRVRRLHRIASAHAGARGDDAPEMPVRAWIESGAAILVVAVVLLSHQRVVRWAMVGEDTGWRHDLIGAGSWLGDRSVVMVIAGMALFGVFFGLAWDRSFRRVFVWCRERLTGRP